MQLFSPDIQPILTILSKRVLCYVTLQVKQVAQRDIVADGNLLHFAVVNNLKEHVRILLEHGLVLSLCKSLALDKVFISFKLIGNQNKSKTKKMR